MEYRITTTWDSLPVLQRPMTLRFKSGVQGLLMEVNAPFFDDPLASPGEAGQAFYGLWEYEVFESLFLNSKTKQYLEVELCKFSFNAHKLLSEGLSLQFKVNITWDQWNGITFLLWEYFPPGIDKMNSYAIHGSGIGRIYEALYSIPREEIEDRQGPNL
uniref:Uncharacterized protein n=1 Tax=Sus scrofa TaxID=9823 RepID=A0A8D1DX51_PIG